MRRRIVGLIIKYADDVSGSDLFEKRLDVIGYPSVESADDVVDILSDNVGIIAGAMGLPVFKKRSNYG